MQTLQSAFSMKRNTSAYSDLVMQLVVICIIAACLVLLAINLAGNLEERSIRSGFGFLWHSAGFEISQTLIPFSPKDSYAAALLSGLFNTIIVAIIAIVLATLFGALIGIAALSQNPSVCIFARTYIEWVRNIPLLVQLYVWYAVFTQMMPPYQQAHKLLPHVYLDSTGLHFPVIQNMHGTGFISILIGIIVIYIYRFTQKRHGNKKPISIQSMLLLTASFTFISWTIYSSSFNPPKLTNFGFKGGGVLLPEFLAMLFGLTIYNAAFIAEIFRAGVLSVPAGQREAGSALGLSYNIVILKIVIPQAMILIRPPLSNQYLNIVKNTSLAMAIGYPDLMSIANTIINQTGQAVEIIALTMGIYFALSLLITTFLNHRNKKILQNMGR